MNGENEDASKAAIGLSVLLGRGFRLLLACSEAPTVKVGLC